MAGGRDGGREVEKGWDFKRATANSQICQALATGWGLPTPGPRPRRRPLPSAPFTDEKTGLEGRARLHVTQQPGADHCAALPLWGPHSAWEMRSSVEAWGFWAAGRRWERWVGDLRAPAPPPDGSRHFAIAPPGRSTRRAEGAGARGAHPRRGPQEWARRCLRPPARPVPSLAGSSGRGGADPTRLQARVLIGFGWPRPGCWRSDPPRVLQEEGSP